MNMRKLLRFFGQALVFGIFAGLMYAIYLAFQLVVRGISSIDSTIAAALLAALTGVFGYWYTQRQTTSRQIAEAHRKYKVELFEKFMEIYEYIMNANRGKGKKVFDPDNLTQKEVGLYQEMTRGLLIWGSPNLIKKWLRFRRASSSDDKTQSLRSIDELFKAFRDELGNSNFGLSRADLIGLFLKDPDEIKI